MHDSATAAQRPDSSSATWSSMVEPSTREQRALVALRDQLAHRVPGRLRRRLPARHHLDLGAPQAGRDLERRRTPRSSPRRRAASRRSPTPGCRTGAASAGCSSVRPPIASWKNSVSTACGHIACSSRGGPREHDDRRLAGHDQPRRGARRVDHVRALRDHRLLAVGGPHGVEVEVAEALHQRPQDVRDALLEVLVERQRAAGEVARPSRSSCRPRSGPARRW